MYASWIILLLFSIGCHQVTANAQLAEAIGSFRRHYNQTLSRRVRIPDSELPPVQTVQNIFNMGDADTPSVCTTEQVATLNNWLVEILELHDAASEAWFLAGEEENGDEGSAMLSRAIMGIKWTGMGVTQTQEDYNAYADIALRLTEVSRLLVGGGLEFPKTTKLPHLFCGDAFATLADPEQPCKDGNGNLVPQYVGDRLVRYQTVREVFKSIQFGPTAKAFWMEYFNAYVLDKTGGDTLCGKSSVKASTGNQGKQYDTEVSNTQTGVYDPWTAVCLDAFEPNDSGAHTAESLANAITYDGYPTAGVGPQLFTYAPYSATLYHELFHLTKGPNKATGDPYGSEVSIFTAGRDSAEDVPTNPESFVQFAVAAYIYQNPPKAPPGSPEKPPVVFNFGVPRTVAGMKSGGKVL